MEATGIVDFLPMFHHQRSLGVRELKRLAQDHQLASADPRLELPLPTSAHLPSCVARSAATDSEQEKGEGWHC